MSKNTILVPTERLRWVGTHAHKRLQQYWTDPLGVSGKGEWRDVPTVLTEEELPNHFPDRTVPAPRIEGGGIVHLTLGGEEHY